MKIIRSYDSRKDAKESLQRGEKVVRAGSFARGSFGCYGRITPSGQPWGGPCSLVTIWHVVAK